jgi:hypothetical protein
MVTREGLAGFLCEAVINVQGKGSWGMNDFLIITHLLHYKRYRFLSFIILLNCVEPLVSHLIYFSGVVTNKTQDPIYKESKQISWFCWRIGVHVIFSHLMDQTTHQTKSNVTLVFIVRRIIKPNNKNSY